MAIAEAAIIVYKCLPPVSGGRDRVPVSLANSDDSHYRDLSFPPTVDMVRSLGASRHSRDRRSPFFVTTTGLERSFSAISCKAFREEALRHKKTGVDDGRKLVFLTVSK